MAFVLTFSNHRGEPATHGPQDIMRFDGSELREHKGGRIIASHREHRWYLEGDAQAYSKLQCDGPLFIFFVDNQGTESRCFGPFAAFSCIDGVAFAASRIVAFCDQEQSDWYSYDLGRHWGTMTVTAEPPSKPHAPTAPAAFPGG